VDVTLFEQKDRQEWDQFVDFCSKGTLFHTIGWKTVIERVFGYESRYFVVRERGRILALLPLFLVKKLIRGKALISVPFGVYGGVCGIHENAERLIIEKAQQLAKELGVDFLEFRHTEENSFSLPTKDLYVTFRRPIFPSDEENLKAVPRKQRRMIRQGINHNFKSQMGGGEYLKNFYYIYSQSLRNLGTPAFPFSFFQAISDEFGERCKILSVWSEGEMVAGVLTFFYKNHVMPYYAGSLPEYFKFAVNDFMYWELMSYGCKNGYKTFDFGRSKRDTGAFKFKEHWGFDPIPLPYQYFLPKDGKLPNLSPANPKIQPLIKMWKRFPLPLANFLGPRIVRYFP
jgi:FemAB-related protein (PEP-CTERM system-associated)